MVNARVPQGASNEMINEAIKKVWQSGIVPPGEMVGVEFYEPMRIEVPSQIQNLIGKQGEAKNSEEENQ